MQKELEALINLSEKEFVSDDEKQAILFLINEVLSSITEEKESKKKHKKSNCLDATFVFIPM